MKKIFLPLAALLLFASVALVGCGGVSQEDYDKLKDDYDALKAQNTTLQNNYNDVKKELDDLKADAAAKEKDVLELSSYRIGVAIDAVLALYAPNFVADLSLVWNTDEGENFLVVDIYAAPGTSSSAFVSQMIDAITALANEFDNQGINNLNWITFYFTEYAGSTLSYFTIVPDDLEDYFSGMSYPIFPDFYDSWQNYDNLFYNALTA